MAAPGFRTIFQSMTSLIVRTLFPTSLVAVTSISLFPTALVVKRPDSNCMAVSVPFPTNLNTVPVGIPDQSQVTLTFIFDAIPG